MVTKSFWLLQYKNMRQVLSYALTGVLINTLGYAVYLLIADLSGAPKFTMTVLYFIGALFGFFVNRKFIFLHDGHIGAAGIRYVIAQFMGYLLNLTLLVLFVDWLGFVHQVVQAVAIVVVAIFLFILLRFFVFAQQSPENRAIRS